MFSWARLVAIACCLLPLEAHGQGSPPGGPEAPASLTLVCLDVGRAVEACNASAQRFTDVSGHTVRVVSADAFGQRALMRYRMLFDIQSPRIDVIQFPAAWSYALGSDLATLDEVAAPEPIPALRDIGVVGERRIGVPIHIAVTILFFREELFSAPPAVWADLREGLLSAASDSATGLSFGAAGGALFPFFMDWIYSFGADSLSDTAAVRSALEALDATLGTIASRNIASASASDAISDFVAGSSGALIARSTAVPFVVGRTEGVGVDAVIRPRAAGVEAPPVLVNAWLVGVSRHSAAPAAALALADFLMSASEQRLTAEEFELAPAARDFYDTAPIVGERRLLREIRERLPQLTLGPLDTYGVAYLELVDSVSLAVRAFIEGEAAVDDTVNAITGAVVRARRQM